MTVALSGLDDADAAPVFRSRFDRDTTSADIVLVGGDAGLVEDARESLDRLWRRWHPAGLDSDLARVNTSATPVSVEPETLLLAGLLADQGAAVEVDYERGTVRRTGVEPLDPAGLAIGLAVDVVIQDVLESGAAGAAIVIAAPAAGVGSVQSVLRVAGVAAHRGGWRINTAGPSNTAGTAGPSNTAGTTDPVQAVTMPEGALATGTDAAGHPIIVFEHQAWMAQHLALTAITTGAPARPSPHAPAWLTIDALPELTQ